ncbi:TPA: hypothetical protein ACGVAJ_001750 [Vibrio vulnificus]|uniref:hypothetical protein n=1 Tax=Vibrio vulnificus TaxID=672 RepID=UPI000AE2609A|nr:hypothetical protein [Vibrio vulnificus]
MTLLGNNWLLASFSATLISASYWPLMPSWPWLMLIVVAIFIIIVRKTCRYLLGVTIALLIAISAGNHYAMASKDPISGRGEYYHKWRR